MLYLTFFKVLLLLLMFFQCHWFQDLQVLWWPVWGGPSWQGDRQGWMGHWIRNFHQRWTNTNTDEEILIHIDILGSNEELIKYTFTIYDLNDDGSLRFESHQKNQFSVIMMIFSKDEMMTLLKDCIVQKDDGWLDILCVPSVTVSHCKYTISKANL